MTSDLREFVSNFLAMRCQTSCFWVVGWFCPVSPALRLVEFRKTTH
jgi:hypothetical protein